MGGVDTVASTAQHLVTTAGVLIGGGWAYMKFVRGRVYAPRAELSVRGELYESGSRRMLLARVELVNAGLTRLRLKPGSQVVHLYTGRASAVTRVVMPSDEHLGVTPILTEHEWVEAQERVSAEVRFLLPAEAVDGECFRVEAQVWARRRRLRRFGQRWTASATVPGSGWTRVLPDPDPAAGGP
ncbi:MAG TPA: hypothetical protein VHJ17_11595 [Thermomonospora sp.]|nr:hypothetical protein [Thermomonospora sp.]